MEYLAHILVIAGIYAVLALSSNLLVGHTGLLSVAHAAFYGLGAYCSALLATKLGVPFLLGLPLAAAAAAGLAFVVALATLRLSGDYFAIATFGLQMIAFSVMNNWIDVTRGPLGIAGVPRLSIFGWMVNSTVKFALLAWAFVLLTNLIVRQLATSPFGRVLRAIREDEVLTQSLGKRTLVFKIKVFCISATLAAAAGSVYAHYMTYVDPSSFTFMESILIVTMVIVGGAGSLHGPVFGAIMLVFLPEALRFLGLPSAVAANLRQVIYGLLLVFLMMYRPQGLVGRYAFVR